MISNKQKSIEDDAISCNEFKSISLGSGLTCGCVCHSPRYLNFPGYGKDL
jgi:hypothetical protein